jgi:hypothetical protein
LEGDPVAEGLELGDGSLVGAVGVAADEVVATQVGIVAVVGEQVPGMTKLAWPTAMAAFLLADAAGQPPAAGRPGSCHGFWPRPRRLGEHLTQPAVALVDLPERRLPPVTLLPGQRPAQEARWPALGNTDMSTRSRR